MTKIDNEDFEARWFAVTVNGKQETYAMQNLQALGHVVYLPIWRRAVKRRAWIMRRGVRKPTTHEVIETGPLFPTYLFVQVRDPKAWPSIFRTHGVRQVVGSSGRPAPVRRGVVEGLQQAELAGLNELMTFDQLNARLAGVEVGDEVRVAMGGVLDELGAIFAEDIDEERATVLVSMCGCESRVKVPKARLSAAPG